jgi:DNA-directed RNA polymerase subunit RPC12/RpoP
MPITLFRACPACGKRFGVKLEERRLVRTESEAHTTTVSVTYAPASRGAPSVAQVPQTTSMTRNEYKEDYQCMRCGHEWSVVKTKIS